MLNKYLAFEASAGSGKTFALAIRYVSLLYMGADASNILTLTFTNKASNEMLERINDILENLGSESKKAELEALCEILECSSEYILSKRAFIYEQFVKSNIKISTIDKFVSSVLRKFSFYYSLSPDFVLERDDLSLLIQTQMILLLKQEGLYESFLDLSTIFDKRFEELIKIFENFYKQGIDYIVNDQYIPCDPKKSFYLFRDLLLGCESLSGTGKKQLLDARLEDILTRTWVVNDSLKDYRYFKKCYEEMCDEYFRDFKTNSAIYLQNKQDHILSTLFKIYELYKRANQLVKSSKNSLSFSDINHFSKELLSSEISKEFFYFRLDANIDHILLDEYQDTSIDQFKILEPLIEEIVSGDGVKSIKSFFYVGDVKQSIYRFRGGFKELFYFTKDRFNVKLEQLNTNYRSSKNVVEFVNDIFIKALPSYHKQIPKSTSGGYVNILKNDEVISTVIKELKELLKHNIKEDDIAILVSTNADALKLHDAVSACGIKSSTEPVLKLRDATNIKCVIEFLKYNYFKEDIYKFNFASMMGFGHGYDIEFHIPVHLSVDEQILSVIEQFEIKLDLNLMRFIEIGYRYKSIEEFLFSIDSLEDTQEITSNIGVRILTIHKSKGLEFDHVIIADYLGKREVTRSDTLIYKYDDINLEKIYIRSKNREFLDKEYKNAIDSEKALQKEDKLNAYYVAFTRAKNSLIVCAKNKDSSFAMLDLKESKIGELKVNPLLNDTAKEAILDYEYESISVGLQNVKNSDTASSEYKSKDLKSINFGIALHYMLEMFDSFSLDEVDMAYFAMLNRFGNILEKKELSDIKQRVKNLLKTKEFMILIDGTRQKEQPYINDEKLKQVDLLVQKDDEVIIIDYKSGNLVRDSHIDQVNEYKRYYEINSSKRVLGYLCYLQNDEIKLYKV